MSRATGGDTQSTHLPCEYDMCGGVVVNGFGWQGLDDGRYVPGLALPDDKMTDS